MITDNYIHTNGSSSPINKTTWLNYLRGREKEIESGKLVGNNYEMSNPQVEFHGNTAILTANIKVTATNKGALTENEYQVTNIWVKEDGEWKRAGFHDGKNK